LKLSLWNIDTNIVKDLWGDVIMN